MKLDKLLCELISINSANINYSNNAAGEKEISNFIYEYFKKNNVDCIKQKVADDRSNVIARIENNKSRNTILFCSHLDTVYLEGMDFNPKIIDGKIYGPGSCDTKASLAAIINAFIEIKNNNLITPNLVFAGVISEEAFHLGIKKFIEKYRDFNAAVIGEPTDLDVGIAHKGILVLRINTMGRSAHSSTPEDGINAIYNMEKLITKLRTDLIPEYNKRICNGLGGPTLNIGVINGGTAFNIVPDFCSIELDRRIIPSEMYEDIINDFRKVIDDLKEREEKFFAEIEKPLDYVPYLETNENERIVGVAKESVAKFKHNAKLLGFPFTTDGGFLSELKTPTIILGPGKVSLCHTLGEYVKVDHLNHATQIYKDICVNY